MACAAHWDVARAPVASAHRREGTRSLWRAPSSLTFSGRSSRGVSANDGSAGTTSPTKDLVGASSSTGAPTRRTNDLAGTRRRRVSARRRRRWDGRETADGRSSTRTPRGRENAARIRSNAPQEAFHAFRSARPPHRRGSIRARGRSIRSTVPPAPARGCPHSTARRRAFAAAVPRDWRPCARRRSCTRRERRHRATIPAPAAATTDDSRNVRSLA